MDDAAAPEEGEPGSVDALTLYLEHGCPDDHEDCEPGSPELVRCLLASLAGPPPDRIGVREDRDGPT